MKSIEYAALWLLRIWRYLVLILTVCGVAVGLFGLYTVVIVKAPFVWFDQIINRPVDVIFLSVFVVVWTAMGAFMLHFGHKALTALSRETRSNSSYSPGEK